ncbi:MAG: hypothetical protein AAB676_20515 [Verrucomicrobiota bacterium]
MRRNASIRSKQWTELIVKLGKGEPSEVASTVDKIRALFVDGPAAEYPWLNRLILLIRELPYQNAFRVIEHLENEIHAGRIPNLGCALVGKDNADRFENKCGREVMEDYWPVFLSAVFARYKLLWYELGVLAVKKKGDLRTAFLVEDPTKILTAMLRWKYGRERIHHPEIQTAMLWVRRQRNCRQLLDRIRKALGSAPRDVSELTLKYFLIEHWPTALRARGDSFVPPLAYMSDMGLDGFLVYAEVGADYLMDAKEKASRTRKIWEHLGLKRSRFAGLDAVSGGVRRGFVRIWEENSKRRCPRRFPSLPLPPISPT